MENPAYWSPIAREINLCDLTEPKEILDLLIKREYVPFDEELYWELLAIISDELVEEELNYRLEVIGGSKGQRISERINMALVGK